MATSKAYYLPETKSTFLASAGTVVHTLTSLGTLAGRQSAQLDFGSGAVAFMFRWRAWVKFATAPVVGEVIDYYIKTSDGTHLDNDDGTGDAAVSDIDKLKNLRYIGSITVDEASNTPEFSASGTVAIFEQIVQIVAWNATADALSSTASDMGFYLEEIPMQGQAA